MDYEEDNLSLLSATAAAEFNAESGFHRLPAEALLRVFGLLGRDDLLRVGAVCRASLLLSEDDSLWPARARRRIFFRKWTFEQQTLARSGGGLSEGALLFPHVVLVSEDRSKVSLLSVLTDSLRPLTLAVEAPCRDLRVERFAGHGSLLISIASLNGGSADETRIAHMHDLQRPARPLLLDGLGEDYFDTVTCLSVNQDSRRVAFGHSDGRVDCFAFCGLACAPEEKRGDADDGDDGGERPAPAVSLSLDASLSRPRGRARLSALHVFSLGEVDEGDAVTPEESVLLCGYTNGRVEMVMRSGAAHDDDDHDDGDGDVGAGAATKRFCLEEGSSVAWLRADGNQILCVCRSLVALSSESLHILEREGKGASFVDGWRRRCVLRPGKGAIVAAHSSRESDSVVLAFTSGIEVWSKASESMLVSAPLNDGQVLSMHSISSASSTLKDDHWVLALTARALYLMRLCHARAPDSQHRRPRRVAANQVARARAFNSLFMSWLDPRSAAHRPRANAQW